MSSIKNQNRAAIWKPAFQDGVSCLRATGINHHYSRHYHDTYSIGVIEAGVGGNNCRGETHYIPAGSIVVMNPGEIHTGYSAGNKSLSYRMLYIDRATFRKSLPEKSKLPYFPEICINDKIRAQKIQMLHVSFEKSHAAFCQQSLLVDFINDFSNRYSEVKPREKEVHEPKAVKLMKDYLHIHYERTVSLDELIQITRLSRAYLIRSFKKTVGLPPHEYLIQLRIGKAMKLLREGTPAVQVAQEVGFTDQSHLSRHFKKLTGTSPRQYAIGHFCTRL